MPREVHRTWNIQRSQGSNISISLVASHISSLDGHACNPFDSNCLLILLCVFLFWCGFPERRTQTETRLQRKILLMLLRSRPHPTGTPKRCAEPTAISQPNSPGGLSMVNDMRSVAATTRVPAYTQKSRGGRYCIQP